MTRRCGIGHERRLRRSVVWRIIPTIWMRRWRRHRNDNNHTVMCIPFHRVRVQAGVTAAKGEEEKTPLAKKLDEFGA